MSEYGIASIRRTVRMWFNRWLTLTEDVRTARLLDMLGLDYFQLLDRLTNARSRKTHPKILAERDS
jgi:hypothetical protein